MEALGKVAGSILVTMLLGLLNGWVLAVMWAWYLVPNLGLPQISVVQGVGISLVVGLLVYQVPPKQEKEIDYAYRIACNIIMPLLVLLMGFLFHGFM